jgi:uncharacterized protein (DUF2062 family)
MKQACAMQGNQNLPLFALSSDISLATASNFSPFFSLSMASSLLLNFSHFLSRERKNVHVSHGTSTYHVKSRAVLWAVTYQYMPDVNAHGALEFGRLGLASLGIPFAAFAALLRLIVGLVLAAAAAALGVLIFAHGKYRRFRSRRELVNGVN